MICTVDEHFCFYVLKVKFILGSKKGWTWHLTHTLTWHSRCEIGTDFSMRPVGVVRIPSGVGGIGNKTFPYTLYVYMTPCFLLSSPYTIVSKGVTVIQNKKTSTMTTFYHSQALHASANSWRREKIFDNSGFSITPLSANGRGWL